MRITDNPPSITQSITIEHGPVGVIGRFFLKAEELALQCGIRLSFASMQDLMAVNAANRQTWHPMISIYDPAVSNIGTDTAYCILGRNARGDVVATQAGRLLDLSKTSFKQEAESLRLFYAGGRAHPACRPAETCVVSAQAGEHMRGRVMFSGGAWYHPDIRGSGLSRFLPRVSRVYGHTRWNTDTTMTMMGETNMNRRVHERNGYRNSDWDVVLDGGPLGRMRLAMLWNSTAETFEDLSHFFDDVAPTLEDDIRQGRTSAAARMIA